MELGPAILARLPEPAEVDSAELRVRLRRVRERLGEAAAEQAFQPPEIRVGQITLRPASGAGRIAHIALNIAWPPPVSIITLRQNMADVKGVDLHGRMLLASDPQAVRTVIIDEPKQQATLPIALKLPPSDDPSARAFRLAKLTGQLTATYLGPRRAFRFRNPAAATADDARQRFGEVTVTLERFSDLGATAGLPSSAGVHSSPLPAGEGTGRSWEARIRVSFAKPGDALASYRGWVFRNRAVLALPGGKQLEPIAAETYLQTPHAVGVAYRFRVEQLPEQTTLIYRTPTSITTRPVPYDLAVAEEASENGERREKERKQNGNHAKAQRRQDRGDKHPRQGRPISLADDLSESHQSYPFAP